VSPATTSARFFFGFAHRPRTVHAARNPIMRFNCPPPSARASAATPGTWSAGPSAHLMTSRPLRLCVRRQAHSRQTYLACSACGHGRTVTLPPLRQVASAAGAVFLPYGTRRPLPAGTAMNDPCRSAANVCSCLVAPCQPRSCVRRCNVRRSREDTHERKLDVVPFAKPEQRIAPLRC
jgi:hypothetical protein